MWQLARLCTCQASISEHKGRVTCKSPECHTVQQQVPLEQHTWPPHQLSCQCYALSCIPPDLRVLQSEVAVSLCCCRVQTDGAAQSSMQRNTAGGMQTW